ncbi:MAG TPA: hypothetical protein VGN28_10045 [Blastococcus sp.]|nr:hypothetical protein [Blastococcus sp.]
MCSVALLSGCGSTPQSSSSASITPGASSSSAGTTSGAPNPNAPETLAAGDIPDNQVYVPFSPPGGGYTVSVPQGWAQSTVAGSPVFTDKFNSVTIETPKAPPTLDVATVTANEVPKLKSTVKGFVLGDVKMVTTASGPAVRITYAATSPPNAVTGTTVALAVERYDFARGGHEVALTLSGAKGADNVDPWKKISDSFRWQK